MDIASIPRWNSLSPWENGAPGASTEGSNAPFQLNPGLNAKIALWKGAHWTLQVDAIVNPTSESLLDDSGVSGEILEAAGGEIYVEIQAAGSCRTGDAVATRACQLPAKKIIHTVTPKYNIKYKIAAENALHGCYRNVLRVGKEEGLTAIAIPCLYSKKKGYPREDALHVALRTVRRFLEHHGDAFDVILLCVDDQFDWHLYSQWLPMYFPRSKDEVASAASTFNGLPNLNLGDEYGEPVIEERKIRISSLVADEQARANAALERFTSDSLVTKDFCEMKDSPDEVRLERIRKRNLGRAKTKSIEPKAAIPYQSYLDQAKHQDLQDIAKLKLIYRAGLDHAGAPVLMVVGKNLPVDAVDLERVMLYIIRVMDAVVERKYTVIYAHGEVTEANQPTTAWLQQLCKTFSSKYRENLKAFYILEATLWLKMTLWVGQSFVHSSFYAKVAYLDSREDVAQVVPTMVWPEDMATTKAA
ncbi:hypothetical protein LEN26_011562 [Aphanomyces euteiches]|nr:hypothetical protein LEN26_011562 [Aphanomyces euteiches]